MELPKFPNFEKDEAKNDTSEPQFGTSSNYDQTEPALEISKSIDSSTNSTKASIRTKPSLNIKRLTRNFLSSVNKAQHEASEELERGKKLPQASITTYDSRLLIGDSALLVPLSSRALRLKPDFIQGSDSEDYNIPNSEMSKGLHFKDYVKCGVKRMKKGRPAVKTNHNYNYIKNSNVPSVTEEALLVPIRLDIDLGDYKLKDNFLWNFHETLITPSNFAEILCNDLNLPAAQYQPLIEESILEQLNRFEDIHLQISSGTNIFEEREQGHDVKVYIELDFLLGRYHFKDAFDWDPSSDTTPEEFASILAADLGLGGEFIVIISHSIREQLLQFFEQKLEILPYLTHRGRASTSMNEIYNLLKATNSKNSYLNMIIPRRGGSEASSFEPFRNPKNIMEVGNSLQFCPSLKYLNDREFEMRLIKEESNTRAVRRRRDAPRRGERSRNLHMRSGTPSGSPAL